MSGAKSWWHQWDREPRWVFFSTTGQPAPCKVWLRRLDLSSICCSDLSDLSIFRVIFIKCLFQECSLIETKTANAGRQRQNKDKQDKTRTKKSKKDKKDKTMTKKDKRKTKREKYWHTFHVSLPAKAFLSPYYDNDNNLWWLFLFKIIDDSG